MKKLLLLLSIALISCQGEALKKEKTQNDDFSVELLFEKDGCKVYRFYDGGTRYFVTSPGSVEWKEQRGKNNSVDITIPTNFSTATL